MLTIDVVVLRGTQKYSAKGILKHSWLFKFTRKTCIWMSNEAAIGAETDLKNNVLGYSAVLF